MDYRVDMMMNVYGGYFYGVQPRTPDEPSPHNSLTNRTNFYIMGFFASETFHHE
ncbi:MAG TPA: hypothetical protein PLV78_13000 [Deltaproteobacteria bacterium]|nr:hypothetical protein [Deltaproteobacteria bacterium]